MLIGAPNQLPIIPVAEVWNSSTMPWSESAVSNEMKAMTNKQEQITPPQIAGKTTEAIASEYCSTTAEAIALFRKACERLFDINHWYEYTGESVMSSKFRLTDSEGNHVSRKPQHGDYIRIELPAPGLDSGDGYDWVRIESLHENEFDIETDSDFCAVRVRPAPNPTSDSDEIAHFYTDLASSTFTILRKGNEVIAKETGRNEIPNNEGNEETKDALRNTVVAETASRGLAWPQWKVLMKGLIKKEKHDD